MAWDRRLTYSVEQGSVLHADADLVALKYAQGFHGADRAVAGVLSEHGSVDQRDLQLGVGETFLVETNGALRAPLALFVGTRSVGEFHYSDASAFAARVVEFAAGMPSVQRLAMTIHGVGFGLDEREAFLAGLDGCGQAFARVRAPGLNSITFVEIDASRVQRLRQSLDALLPAERSGSGLDWARVGGASGWGVAVGTSPGDDDMPAPLPQELRPELEAKPSVFVALPFTKEGRNLFDYPIQSAAHASGYVCERIDQQVYEGDVLAHIKKRIACASVVVADLSGQNPNVHLEVGYAWGCGRPTVLLLPAGEKPAFDVAGQKQLHFSEFSELEKLLTRELEGLRGATA